MRPISWLDEDCTLRCIQELVPLPIANLGWRYVLPAEMPRRPQDVLVEPWVREALVRLNPEIAAQPDRADDVLYKLRAIIMGVRSNGLVKANEEFSAWLTGRLFYAFRQER